jgi:hypothetical protein
MGPSCPAGTNTASTSTLTTTTPINQPILVRSAAGLILGSGEVKSASIRSSDMTGNQRVGMLNGLQLINLPLVAYGDFNGVRIDCAIIIGGVTYIDGSTMKFISYADLANNQTQVLNFQKPVNAHSSCHKFTIYQNNTTIATYN